MNDEYDGDEFWTGGEVFTFDPEIQGIANKKLIIQNDDYQIIKKKSAGCTCIKCGDFYEYAEANQDDGTFKCWGCRH